MLGLSIAGDTTLGVSPLFIPKYDLNRQLEFIAYCITLNFKVKSSSTLMRSAVFVRVSKKALSNTTLSPSTSDTLLPLIMLVKLPFPCC